MSPRRARAVANLAALALAALAAPVAGAACTFSGGEIVNPLDPTCGGVQLTYTSNAIAAADEIALGYPVPVPVASLTPIAGFRTHASLHARHEDLVLSTATVQSHAVGVTRAGRAIHAYALGDADSTVAGSTRAEPAIMVNGTIHAREWQSPEAVTEFMERLALNAGDGGFYQYLAENLTVIVLPVMNLDGFLQTQAHPDRVTAHPAQPRDGRMRRKNLRTTSGGVVDGDLGTVGDNFEGVDLNRNSDVGWGDNGGSSGSGTSLIYRGTAPATEPEILALRAAAALVPASALRMYSDTHSFTRAFLVSTTSDTGLTAETTALLATMRAAGTSVPYGALFDSPNSDIGTTADWFNATFQIPSWTLEIEPTSAAEYGSSHGHAGFITPDSRIAAVRDDVARMYVRGAYAMAGPPAVREVALTPTGGGAPAYHARWADSGASRSLTVLASSELVPGASYTLWVAFDKPLAQTGATSVTTVELRRPEGGRIATLAQTAAPLATVVTGGIGGASRYSRDALTVTVTMPASFPVAAPRLALATSDLAGRGLDADPRTPARWQNGGWVDYEPAGAAPADGGFDASYALQAPATAGGGGGGAFGGLGLALLLGALALRRARA